MAEEIKRMVAPLLPDNRGAAVDRCIEQGLASGLFTTVADEGPVIDRVDLVKRLRAEGKIEAAYICQYDSAEREPDNPNNLVILGELARILGRRAEARSAYERYLEIRPDDAEIRHLLIALRDEVAPLRAANDAIEHLYARFASFYESNMLGELDYQAPARVSGLNAELMGERHDLEALDLGCGSGLAGAEVRPRCSRLIGVDLSPHMLERARERAIYDALECAEVTAWITRCRDAFDLILACDSLIYFGDLSPVIRPAKSLLKPDGLFIFTLERGEHRPFRLSDSGRYTHHPSYIRQVAAEAGFRVVHMEPGFLRMEYGEEVIGLIVALGVASQKIPYAKNKKQ